MTNQTNGKDPLIHFPFYLNQYQGILSRYSLQEKGAFISLLCVFLLEDEDLPQNFEQLCRMCLAFSDDEKHAVREVKNHVIEIGKEILKNQKQKREKCRQAASLGGSARAVNAKANAKRTLKRTSSNTENREQIQRTDTEIEIDYSQELVDGLKFVLETKLNRKLNTSSWKKEIEKLLKQLSTRPNPIDDVKKAIQLIADHYGEQYFPVVQSASALREKFDKLEAAAKRLSSRQTQPAQEIYNNLMEKFSDD